MTTSFFYKPLVLLLALVFVNISNAQDSYGFYNESSLIQLPEGASEYAAFRCSVKDSAGNLWFGTTGAGIYRCDMETGTFTHFAEKDGLFNTIVYTIAVDKEGTIWAGTQGGIFCGNPSKQLQEGEFIFTPLVIPGVVANHLNPEPVTATSDNKSAQYYKSLPVYSLLIDSKNKVWFGLLDLGLWCYDLQLE